MGLILDHPPGCAAAWVGHGMLRLDAAPSAVALHAAGPGRLRASLWRNGAMLAQAASVGAAGWRWLALAAEADELRWEAPALRLTLAEGRATPALRLWAGPAPALVWLGAAILGPGALLPLEGGPPVPHLRLAAGDVCRITLGAPPPTGAVALMDTLRGMSPRLDWQGRTLILRAGAAWDGILPGLATG